MFMGQKKQGTKNGAEKGTRKRREGYMSK